LRPSFSRDQLGRHARRILREKARRFIEILRSLRGLGHQRAFSGPDHLHFREPRAQCAQVAFGARTRGGQLSRISDTCRFMRLDRLQDALMSVDFELHFNLVQLELSVEVEIFPAAQHALIEPRHARTRRRIARLYQVRAFVPETRNLGAFTDEHHRLTVTDNGHGGTPRVVRELRVLRSAQHHDRNVDQCIVMLRWHMPQQCVAHCIGVRGIVY
jgi:hypothetical protein